MQAPTPESEPNPYLVFRQRAKPNKPLTRRRRETQDESVDKMAAIVENLDHALRLANMLREREGQKMCLVVRFCACAALRQRMHQLISVRMQVDVRREAPASVSVSVLCHGPALQRVWQCTSMAGLTT